MAKGKSFSDKDIKNLVDKARDMPQTGKSISDRDYKVFERIGRRDAYTGDRKMIAVTGHTKKI